MNSHALSIDVQRVPSGDGWLLPLKRTVSPAHRRRDLRPVLILPGYGMNGFIFGFHPGGRSMERELAELGFEVWTGGFRRQVDARRLDRRAPPPSIEAYAATDTSALVRAVLASTDNAADRLDLIGASLGGSVAYAHLALFPDAPVGAVIGVGAPFRWEQRHPLMSWAFGSRRLAGLVPMYGMRHLSRRAFPLAARVPSVLSIYMNMAHLDEKHVRDLLKTVDEPHHRLNYDLACWLKTRDLVVRGVNVTTAVAGLGQPLLVVAANRDGIVPLPTARSVEAHWGGPTTMHIVGTDEDWYAHADMFMAPEAPSVVFAPMAAWLAEQQSAEIPAAAK